MEDQEFEKIIEQLDENPSFVKAQIDEKLINLQKQVVEFITSVILNHEMEFYQLIQKIFPSKMEDLLCSTGPSIIQMITETINKFYNKIYYDIQHKNETPITILVLSMGQFTDYGPHILLDKLLRLTLEIHLDVNREELVINSDKYDSTTNTDKCDTNNYKLDIYQKTVLNQINIGLNSKNLIHIMSKGEDEDTDFVNIPEGNNAFSIVIDKNIE